MQFPPFAYADGTLSVLCNFVQMVIRLFCYLPPFDVDFHNKYPQAELENVYYYKISLSAAVVLVNKFSHIQHKKRGYEQ